MATKSINQEEQVAVRLDIIILPCLDQSRLGRNFFLAADTNEFSWCFSYLHRQTESENLERDSRSFVKVDFFF